MIPTYIKVLPDPICFLLKPNREKRRSALKMAAIDESYGSCLNPFEARPLITAGLKTLKALSGLR